MCPPKMVMRVCVRAQLQRWRDVTAPRKRSAVDVAEQMELHSLSCGSMLTPGGRNANNIIDLHRKIDFKNVLIGFYYIITRYI